MIVSNVQNQIPQPEYRMLPSDATWVTILTTLEDVGGVEVLAKFPAFLSQLKSNEEVLSDELKKVLNSKEFSQEQAEFLKQALVQEGFDQIEPRSKSETPEDQKTPQHALLMLKNYNKKIAEEAEEAEAKEWSDFFKNYDPVSKEDDLDAKFLNFISFASSNQELAKQIIIDHIRPRLNKLGLSPAKINALRKVMGLETKKTKRKPGITRDQDQQRLVRDLFRRKPDSATIRASRKRAKSSSSAPKEEPTLEQPLPKTETKNKYSVEESLDNQSDLDRLLLEVYRADGMRVDLKAHNLPSSMITAKKAAISRIRNEVKAFLNSEHGLSKNNPHLQELKNFLNPKKTKFAPSPHPDTDRTEVAEEEAEEDTDITLDDQVKPFEFRDFENNLISIRATLDAVTSQTDHEQAFSRILQSFQEIDQTISLPDFKLPADKVGDYKTSLQGIQKSINIANLFGSSKFNLVEGAKVHKRTIKKILKKLEGISNLTDN